MSINESVLGHSAGSSLQQTGSEWISEQGLDRLSVFKTNLSTSSDVFVPLFVRFYEQKLNQLSVTSHNQQQRRCDRQPPLLCCVWLTNLSVAATLRFMGDWWCHQSACRVKSTVCPCCRSVLPACRCPQITVLKEEGIIFQSEAAMRLIPS